MPCYPCWAEASTRVLPEAAEGGKSPGLEAVPPLIYSEAFIIELISALQRDCQ